MEFFGNTVFLCVKIVLFVMELEGLHGRDVLKGYDVESVITYPGK